MTIVVMRADVGTVLEPFLRLVTLYVTSRTRGLGGLEAWRLGRNQLIKSTDERRREVL